MQTVVWQNLILLYHLSYITFTTPHHTRWGGQFLGGTPISPTSCRHLRIVTKSPWKLSLLFVLTRNTENLQIWFKSNDVLQIKYTDLPYIFLKVLDNLYCNFPSTVQFYRPVKNRSTASSHHYQPMTILLPDNLTGHFYHKKNIIPTTSLTIVHIWVQHIVWLAPVHKSIRSLPHLFQQIKSEFLWMIIVFL